MTVKELIEKLQEMPEYYKVDIYVDRKDPEIYDELRIHDVKISPKYCPSTVWICGD